MFARAPKGVSRLARWRRFLSAGDGSAAVEFAFVAPVLIILLVATAEFGRLMGLRNELQFAAEQAGRFAIVNRAATDTTLQTQTKSHVVTVPPADVTVTIARTTASGVNYVAITARANYAFLSYLGLSAVSLSGSTRVPLVVIQ